MKTMTLATIAVISLAVGAANAQSYSHAAPPNRQPATQFKSMNGGG